MTRACLLVLLTPLVTTYVDDSEVSLGFLGGVQLLEKQDPGGSHGPLVEKITLGRSALAGLFLDFRLRERHHLTVELAAGPYHNDIERACVEFSSDASACPPPRPFYKTRYAVHYGLHWSFLFKRHGNTPFVGCGVGAKAYSYDELNGGLEDNASLALHAAIGFEAASRAPFRVEVRGILVHHNPFLSAARFYERSADQLELQVRASLRFTLSRLK